MKWQKERENFLGSFRILENTLSIPKMLIICQGSNKIPFSYYLRTIEFQKIRNSLLHVLAPFCCKFSNTKYSLSKTLPRDKLLLNIRQALAQK